MDSCSYCYYPVSCSRAAQKCWVNTCEFFEERKKITRHLVSLTTWSIQYIVYTISESFCAEIIIYWKWLIFFSNWTCQSYWSLAASEILVTWIFNRTSIAHIVEAAIAVYQLVNTANVPDLPFLFFVNGTIHIKFLHVVILTL